MLLAFFIIIALLIFLALFFVIIGIVVMLYTRVPYAPTPKIFIDKIINELEIKKDDRVYDLGSGDGRFLFAAAKKGAIASGFEISLIPYLYSKFISIFKEHRVTIQYKNFFHQKLNDADVVFCFLVGNVMSRVEKKLDSELRPGTKVVSYGFHLPTWTPIKTIFPNNKKTSNIYIYTKK